MPGNEDTKASTTVSQSQLQYQTTTQYAQLVTSLADGWQASLEADMIVESLLLVS